MTKELYLESERLYHDIKYLRQVIESFAKGHGIKPITTSVKGEYNNLSKETQQQIANAIKHVVTDLELEFEELK